MANILLIQNRLHFYLLLFNLSKITHPHACWILLYSKSSFSVAVPQYNIPEEKLASINSLAQTAWAHYQSKACPCLNHTWHWAPVPSRRTCCKHSWVQEVEENSCMFQLCLWSRLQGIDTPWHTSWCEI